MGGSGNGAKTKVNYQGELAPNSHGVRAYEASRGGEQAGALPGCGNVAPRDSAPAPGLRPLSAAPADHAGWAGGTV